MKALGVATGWAGWAKSRGPRMQGVSSPEQEIVKNNFPVTVKIMTSGHQTVHCNTPNLRSVRASCAGE